MEWWEKLPSKFNIPLKYYTNNTSIIIELMKYKNLKLDQEVFDYKENCIFSLKFSSVNNIEKYLKKTM